MSEGWISLHRKIQHNWLWIENRKFSKFEAWIDLLFSANHRENKILIDNELVCIKTGSFITSELKLAEKWKWHRTTVRSFLHLLEQEKMAIKKCTTKYTMITVENWALYQMLEQRIVQRKNNERTTRRHKQ